MFWGGSCTIAAPIGVDRQIEWYLRVRSVVGDQNWHPCPFLKRNTYYHVGQESPLPSCNILRRKSSLSRDKDSSSAMATKDQSRYQAATRCDEKLSFLGQGFQFGYSDEKTGGECRAQVTVNDTGSLAPQSSAHPVYIAIAWYRLPAEPIVKLWQNY